ncbi:MAG: hypothetical protein P1P64_00790 [Treponemataceae bacterium]
MSRGFYLDINVLLLFLAFIRLTVPCENLPATDGEPVFCALTFVRLERALRK